MKKNIAKLILLLLVLVPIFGVNAESNDKVNVYIFRGEGCPHCEEALEYFDSIEKEYGKYYNLVKYEVWYDKDNSALMTDVAKKLNETVTGVPYIIIGKNTYKGFNSAQMSEEIKKNIKEEYDKPVSERFDVLQEKPKEKNVLTDGIVIMGIILVIGGITFIRFKNK